MVSIFKKKKPHSLQFSESEAKGSRRLNHTKWQYKSKAKAISSLIVLTVLFISRLENDNTAPKILIESDCLLLTTNVFVRILSITFIFTGVGGGIAAAAPPFFYWDWLWHFMFD